MKVLSTAIGIALLCSNAVLANEAGEELYMEYCQSCHGEDKSGVQGYDADLAAFTDRLNGDTEDMPDFIDFFDDDEILALHEYVTTAE